MKIIAMMVAFVMTIILLPIILLASVVFGPYRVMVWLEGIHKELEKKKKLLEKTPQKIRKKKGLMFYLFPKRTLMKQGLTVKGKNSKIKIIK